MIERDYGKSGSTFKQNMEIKRHSKIILELKDQWKLNFRCSHQISKKFKKKLEKDFWNNIDLSILFQNKIYEHKLLFLKFDRKKELFCSQVQMKIPLNKFKIQKQLALNPLVLFYDISKH